MERLPPPCEGVAGSERVGALVGASTRGVGRGADLWTRLTSRLACGGGLDVVGCWTRGAGALGTGDGAIDLIERCDGAGMFCPIELPLRGLLQVGLAGETGALGNVRVGVAGTTCLSRVIVDGATVEGTFRGATMFRVFGGAVATLERDCHSCPVIELRAGNCRNELPPGWVVATGFCVGLVFGAVTFGEAMDRPGVVTCRDGDCDHVRGTVVGVDAVGAATVGV